MVLIELKVFYTKNILLYRYDYTRLVTNEIYNHFEFHKELTTKTGLLKNLKKYSDLRIFNLYAFIPISFQLNL